MTDKDIKEIMLNMIGSDVNRYAMDTINTMPITGGEKLTMLVGVYSLTLVRALVAVDNGKPDFFDGFCERLKPIFEDEKKSLQEFREKKKLERAMAAMQEKDDE